MTADDVKRLDELEAENAWLKRIVADPALDIQGLKQLSAGKFGVRRVRRRAVLVLHEQLGMSERRACWLAGQHRSTHRHDPSVARDERACGRGRVGFRASVRGGGVAGPPAAATGRVGVEYEAHSPGVARRGSGCRASAASAIGWASPQCRPSDCEPSGPITRGRPTFKGDQTARAQPQAVARHGRVHPRGIRDRVSGHSHRCSPHRAPSPTPGSSPCAPDAPAPAGPPRSAVSSTSASIPSRSAGAAGSNIPALATAR